MTSTASPTIERRVLLRDISWETYETLVRELEGQHLRLTYDRGLLEIMSPSPTHGRIGKFIARMVESLTLELNIPLVGLGNTTWKKQSAGRGLEADECYYIARAEWAMSREDFDLEVDPPPDLAIEVDVTASSIDKEVIYASLGVPELWRYDDSLQILALDPNGEYAAREVSQFLPMLPRSVVDQFVARRTTAHDTALMLEFVQWVRSNRVQ